MTLKAFHIAQNETPKMVNTSSSTNKLSLNFAEHVSWKVVYDVEAYNVSGIIGHIFQLPPPQYHIKAWS